MANNSKKIKVALYQPDYETTCDNCGQSPVVIIKNEKGEVIENTEMCGVCLWGDADCLYPENW